MAFDVKDGIIDYDSDNLFVDITKRSNMPFQLFFGPRGDGKTFSVLRSGIMEEPFTGYKESIGERKFIYLRRRQQEIQIATSETANPFKSINSKYGCFVYPKYKVKDKYSTFYAQLNDGSRVACGFGMALSTFSNLRGVNFEDVDDIMFDEAIPEKIAAKMQGEGKALLNLYETVNRNREFFGKPPVKMYIVSNAIDLSADLLIELRVVNVIAHMISKGQTRYTNKERGLYIELLSHKDFTEKKSETALYKLTANSEFSDFALKNKFIFNDTTAVKKVPINEYKPVATFIDTYTIYTHKTGMSLHCAEANPDSNQARFNQAEVDMFRSYYGKIYQKYQTFNRLTFDNYATKVALDSILAKLSYRRI